MSKIVILQSVCALTYVVSFVYAKTQCTVQPSFSAMWRLKLFWSMKASELQKRADRAEGSVLIFLANANFWEKHAKNCSIMSMAHVTYTIAH